MLYALGLLVLLFVGLIWYIRQHVVIPANTDAIIGEIKAEGVPELMPGKQTFVHNEGITICYEVIAPKQASPKATILLIHGHSQTLLDFPPHFFEPLLEAGYQVLRMDHRGVGCSSWVQEWNKKNAFTLEDMATDVLAVLDDLGLEKVHIVGMSMGGMIAQSLLIHHAQRFLSLTSIMSTGYYYDSDLIGLDRKFYWKFVLSTLIYGRKATNLEGKLKAHIGIYQLLHGKGGYPFDLKAILQKAFYENTQRNGYNKDVALKHTTAIGRSGSRYEALKQIQIPTLVIHGTDDPLILFEHAQKYAPMIPNAKTLFIEGMGHDLNTTHTPQMVNALLDLIKNIKM